MRTLVLFTRGPRAEARAKGLPRKAGARLFRALVESWVQSARRAEVQPVIMAPAGSLAELKRLFAGDGVPIEAQCPGTLGERLQDAFTRAFARGASPVMVAGGDSPAPAPTELARAFADLASGDRVVLGPSPDGGVYAIGLASPAATLMQDVPWLSADVERALRERAAALGLPVAALPPALDIDGVADLRRAFALAGCDVKWRPLQSALAALLAAAPPASTAAARTPLALLASDLAARGPPASSSLQN